MSKHQTIGALASAAWVERHGLHVSGTPHWYLEISIPTDAADTRFEINIYPEEWGIIFRRGNRVSSIRVTDLPFVHGLDDHRLLQHVSDIETIDHILALLEQRYDLAFHRMKATVRSNLTRAASIVRAWLVWHRA
jgi:hypothetical protein